MRRWGGGRQSNDGTSSVRVGDVDQRSIRLFNSGAMAATTKRRSTAETPDLPRFDVSIEDLYLDASNPRLGGSLIGTPTQDQILEVLWREMAVDEIAISIAKNGYQRYEPLFATHEKGRWIVIEGNRRLAAAKLLLHSELRKKVRATDLPEISAEVRRGLQKLPVIHCTRGNVWQYIGFKHVNGPQVWQSYAKAQYIAWVHETEGVALEEIAERIGDKNSTVVRLYRGLVTLRQAKETGVFDVDNRYKKKFAFSHLYTGLDYAGFQQFLGLRPNAPARPNPVPKAKLSNLGQLCVWLYGDKAQDIPPQIESQNPDLKILEEVLRSDAGVVALRRKLPLAAAHQLSIGDERIFRDSLHTARQSLTQARGVSLHGFNGEPELLRIAEEIVDLGEILFREMKRKSLEKVSAPGAGLNTRKAK